jgi:hypothetical protein
VTTQPLYFGGEMDAFLPSDSSVVETTTGGTYDATYSRCSIVVSQGSSLKSIQFPSQTGGVYFNFCVFYQPNINASAPNEIFYILDNTGAVVFKVSFLFNGLYVYLVRMYYYNGSGYTQIGNGVNVGYLTLNYFTIYVNKTTGTATLYVGGSQQDTGTVGSFPSITNFAQAQYYNQPSVVNVSIYWSQLFASISPTLGQRLYTLVEDTNGAAQDWTGAVTDINELVFNDATGITSASVNQVSTYYKNGLSTSGVVLGIGTSARFNIGATGPQNIQNVLRVSGTNYTSPSTLGTTGFAPAQYMWMTNPATSTAWTNATANTIEWGVKSIT